VKAYTSIAEKCEIVVVEGAGGWLAPIGEPPQPGMPGPTMADVAAQLRLPVVLVVGLRLGCINHALLTADAIRSRGVELLGWIANPVDPDFMPGTDSHAAYVLALEQRLPAPRLQLR
jgi:dethiobiotin synthetase